MENITYFISDIHLGLSSKEKEAIKEEKLLYFLDSINFSGTNLFILGDLFDYWFEYREVIQKGNFRLFTKLKELTDNKVTIKYLIGNHDFLHRNFFQDYLGVEVIATEVEVSINKKRFFLGHGDGLVKNDLGYKILKSILRNKFIQMIYSLIHPDFGIWLAKNTSKKSRDFTNEKNYGEIDGLLETAKIKIDNGFDYVIFGHSHKREITKYKEGYYINLGAWLDQPCYGRFKENKFDIINW